MGDESRRCVHRVPCGHSEGQKRPRRGSHDEQQDESEQPHYRVLHAEVHGEIEEPEVARARRAEGGGEEG